MPARTCAGMRTCVCIHNCWWGPPRCTPRVMVATQPFLPPAPLNRTCHSVSISLMPQQTGGGAGSDPPLPQPASPEGSIRDERCVRHSGEGVPTEGTTWGMGEGARSCASCPRRSPSGWPWQKRQGFWEAGSGEGPRVCQAGPDSQMWSLGLLAPAPQHPSARAGPSQA